MYLNNGRKEEYRNRHRQLGTELKALLSEAGIRDYSIFLDEETGVLFAYQKLEGEQNSQDLGKEEIVQRWWKFMADLMKTNPDLSPVSVPLEELFYFSGEPGK